MLFVNSSNLTYYHHTEERRVCLSVPMRRFALMLPMKVDEFRLKRRIIFPTRGKRVVRIDIIRLSFGYPLFLFHKRTSTIKAFTYESTIESSRSTVLQGREKMGGEHEREGERVTSVTGFTLRLSSALFKHPGGILASLRCAAEPLFHDFTITHGWQLPYQRLLAERAKQESSQAFCNLRDSY